jgi:hypothetical protein
MAALLATDSSLSYISALNMEGACCTETSCQSTRLQGVTIQKIAIWTITTAKTSKHINIETPFRKIIIVKIESLLSRTKVALSQMFAHKVSGM